eukprot:Rmarinus@m.6416
MRKIIRYLILVLTVICTSCPTSYGEELSVHFFEDIIDTPSHVRVDTSGVVLGEMVSDLDGVLVDVENFRWNLYVVDNRTFVFEDDVALKTFGTVTISVPQARYQLVLKDRTGHGGVGGLIEQEGVYLTGWEGFEYTVELHLPFEVGCASGHVVKVEFHGNDNFDWISWNILYGGDTGFEEKVLRADVSLVEGEYMMQRVHLPPGDYRVFVFQGGSYPCGFTVVDESTSEFLLGDWAATGFILEDTDLHTFTVAASSGGNEVDEATAGDESGPDFECGAMWSLKEDNNTGVSVEFEISFGAEAHMIAYNILNLEDYTFVWDQFREGGMEDISYEFITDALFSGFDVFDTKWDYLEVVDLQSLHFVETLPPGDYELVIYDIPPYPDVEYTPEASYIFMMYELPTMEIPYEPEGEISGAIVDGTGTIVSFLPEDVVGDGRIRFSVIQPRELILDISCTDSSLIWNFALDDALKSPEYVFSFNRTCNSTATASVRPGTYSLYSWIPLASIPTAVNITIVDATGSHYLVQDVVTIEGSDLIKTFVVPNVSSADDFYLVEETLSELTPVSLSFFVRVQGASYNVYDFGAEAYVLQEFQPLTRGGWYELKHELPIGSYSLVLR